MRGPRRMLKEAVLITIILVGAMGWLRSADGPADGGPAAAHTKGPSDEGRGPFAQLFQDAKRRLAGEVPGDSSQGIRFQISPGARELRIGAGFALDGEGTFTLVDPLLREQVERLDGENKVVVDDWKTIKDPLPGDWRMDVELGATGSYVFGFYY